MWTQGFNFAGAKALKEAKIPLVGFVNEKNVISPKEKDIRTAILGTWIDAGAELGNGTFSDIQPKFQDFSEIPCVPPRNRIE